MINKWWFIMNHSGVFVYKYSSTYYRGGCKLSDVMKRPNKTSSVASVKKELLVELNHCNTFLIKDFVKWQLINVWSIESVSPQYIQYPSSLTLNLKSSFLVIKILWMTLKWNCRSSFSLEVLRTDWNICFQLIFSEVSDLSQRFGPVWLFVWVLFTTS